MRNAATAEWILSLVSDNAASTVGDLVEESSPRGALWFWSSVLRAAGSHFWRDLSASPWRMVRLAFWGVLATWYFLATFAMPMLAVNGVKVVNLNSALVALAMPMLAVHRYWTPTWEIPFLTVLGCAVPPFLAGRAVACRSNGRELPAAFAVLTLKAALYAVELRLSAMQVRRIGQPYPGIEHAFAVVCVESLFVVAGATVYRLRILAAREEARQ
ncbi:MAG: hypothetical protein ABSF25_18520 [Bryobacteraceae bacterium]|jgi:hypothetical protein